MALFKLGNLTDLHLSMIRNKFDYQVFDFTYNKINFSSLLINGVKDFDIPNARKCYTLSIFKKGTTESMRFNLKKKDDELLVDTYLHGRYKELTRFLEVKYDPKNKFIPTEFFFFIDNNSPSNASMNFLDRKICAKYYPTTKDNEQDKIYFLSFRDNDKAKVRKDGKKQQRSPENYNKTETLIPEANKIIGNRNISVRFTSEDRYRLNESNNIIENNKRL